MASDGQRTLLPIRGGIGGSRRHLGSALLGAWLMILGTMPASGQFPFFGNSDPSLEVTLQLSHGPGGMTITPTGSYVISLHQYFRSQKRVLEVTADGEVRPFPPPLQPGTAGDSELVLDSVLGVQSDDEGIVWMVDNGTRGESTPKLVAWDTEHDELHRVIYLPKPIVRPTSFLDDLALDPEAPYIYISDPASGKDAAIIVVELNTGRSRRVLEGRFGLVPEDIELRVEGKPVTVRRPDGSSIEPQIGVNSIAVDRRGRWLYFGPMKGRTLYRIATEDLHDRTLTAQELASRVEGYAEKPISDGISIDSKNNIYVADLERSAIGVIRAKDRKYEVYVTDPRIVWPDGLCFGTDGKLHFFCNQLNRCGIYNGGKGSAEPPFLVFRIKVLASGTVGR